MAEPTVTIHTNLLEDLLAEPIVVVEPAPPPFAVHREVALTPDDGGLRVVARWQVAVPAPGEVSWALAGPEVTVERVSVDGVATALGAGNVLVRHFERPATVVLTGRVDGGAVPLWPAAAGAVRHPADVRLAEAPVVRATASAGAPATLTLLPARTSSPPRALALGEVAVGVAVGDAVTEVRANARYVILGAPVDAVSFTAPSAGPDLDVRGPLVRSWSREGDRISVALSAPEPALVSLDVSWSTATPRAEQTTIPAPYLALDGVLRTAATLELAREPEIDLVPHLVGAEPVPTSALRSSLAVGLPVGAYRGRVQGSLEIFRYAPASGPATLVDVASTTVLLTEEGHVLLRSVYAVRNDRGATLRVTPPPGVRPVGVKVSGSTVTPARQGESWLIPLEKSVETVEGLLTFPIEVVWLGRAPNLDLRRGAVLALPVVDADVAVARATVLLPRHLTGRVEVGEGDRVADFAAGDAMTYGYAVGDVRAVRAEVLFREAVDAWKGNDFAAVGNKLDALQEMGAQSTDIDRLSSNVDAVRVGSDDANARRVLEQARARSLDDALAQEAALEQAGQAYAAGEYDRAEAAYQQALDLGDKLGAIGGEDQRSRNADVKEKLDETRNARERKDANGPEEADHGLAEEKLQDSDSRSLGVAMEGALLDAEPSPVAPLGRASENQPAGQPAPREVDRRGRFTYKERTEIDFEGVDITGELVQPQGALLLDRTRTEMSPLIPLGPPSTFGDAMPPPFLPDEPGATVTAAALGVVWPPAGDTLRYQRLLLPPEAPWSVPVRARIRRGGG